MMNSAFATYPNTSPPAPAHHVFTMPTPMPSPIPVAAAAEVPVQLVPLQYGVEIPNRVFVGGCPYNMTEKELGDFFSQFGPIKDSKIVFDKVTGKSLGYGFVTYICETDAVNVYCKGSIFYNEKKLNVSKAFRKHGGQFVRPNQEFMNGMYVQHQPNGFFVDQSGLWVNQVATQQVKPCYTVLVSPGMQQQQAGVSYGVHSPTQLAPIGTTYMPQQSYQPYTPLSHSFTPLAQPHSIQDIISNPHYQSLSEPQAMQVSELEGNVSSEQNLSFESDKELQESGACVSDSAYSSDHSSQETISGVDLDRLFDRRNSPITNRRRPTTLRRRNNSQNNPEPCYIPPPPQQHQQQHNIGLLPHPVGYPVANGYATVPM